ncbi:MAG TPA: hypothetical protein VFR94_17485 [Nitrososphaeraceae archaeon]|nr:hypothetical protein [Nitrososphaeraceae archaeon]
MVRAIREGKKGVWIYTRNNDSVIEESNAECGTRTQIVLGFPGMLLSPLGDLSHSSILYYRTHRARLNPH